MIFSAKKIQPQRDFFTQCLLHWWSTNKRSFPWRTTTDKYHVLVAELLLRRTNAPAAHAVYVDFLAKYPTASRLSVGQSNEIASICGRLGLNWRAQNVVQLAKYFESEGPEIPDTVESLLSLPGIGPYVARAVLVNCSNLQAVPVDSNVVRVICRFFGMEARDSLRKNKQFQEMADSLVEETPAREFNFALLDFASSICRAKSPKCSSCPLAARCKSVNKFKKNQTAER